MHCPDMAAQPSAGRSPAGKRRGRRGIAAHARNANKARSSGALRRFERLRVKKFQIIKLHQIKPHGALCAINRKGEPIVFSRSKL